MENELTQLSFLWAATNPMVYSGQSLTVWSIRLALLAYVVSLAISLTARRRYQEINRWIWIAGCGLFVMHVLCAFGFVHHWSHVDAYNETAKQTNEVAGLNWGGGIYFNYVFTLVWILDAFWWWRSPKTYIERHVGWNIGLHAFFLFIAFNAVVVFESGPIRWAGIAAPVVLVVLAICSARRTRLPTTKKA